MPNLQQHNPLTEPHIWFITGLLASQAHIGCVTTMFPRITSRSVYWLLLHAVVIELGIYIIFGLALALFAHDVTGLSILYFRQLYDTSASLLWLMLPAFFAFAAYASPYSRFWLCWALLALAVWSMSFLNYVLPVGQFSIWIAAMLGSAARYHALSTVGIAVLPAAIVIAICLHIRQLLKQPPGEGYAGRYSLIGATLALAYGAYIIYQLWQGYGHFFPGARTQDLADALPLTSSPALNAPSYLQTPSHIIPEWDSLPFYAILRAIPGKTEGVIVLCASLGVFLLLPWLDPGPARPFWRRPFVGWVVASIMLTIIALGVLGTRAPDGWVYIASQAATAAYFFLFLIAMPLASRAERRRTPRA